jgi:gliding motility-associated-like protein
MNKRRFILLIVLILIVKQNFAQHENSIWIFNQQAIAFNNSDTNNIIKHEPSKLAFTSYTGKDGNIKLYTNGNVLSDGKQIITFREEDNNAKQPALIMPVPQKNDSFYVFLSNRFYYEYAIVDIKNISNAKFTNLNIDSYGAQTTIYDDTRSDFWYICYGKENILSYKITKNGIFKPFSSKIEENKTNVEGLIIKSSACGKFVATSAINYNIQIYNFNNITGALTNPVKIIDDNGNAIIAKDIEFSASGTAIYFIAKDTDGIYNTIYKYDINTKTLIQIGKAPNGEINGLQLAPDGNIYTLYRLSVFTQGEYLSAINEQDIKWEAIKLSQINNTLPCFSNALYKYLNFSWKEVNCFGERIDIKIFNKDSINDVLWNFGFEGDNNTSNEIEPELDYPYSGEFTITLTAYFDNRSLELKQMKKIKIPESISPIIFPVNLSLCGENDNENITVKCKNEENNTYTYKWLLNNNNIDKFQKEINISEKGFYKVEVRNERQCLETSSIQVLKTESINVEPIEDKYFCTEPFNYKIAPKIKENISNLNYIWNTGETSATIDVQYSGIYDVEISFRNCKVNEIINVDLFKNPILSSSHVTACANQEFLLQAATSQPAAVIFDNSNISQLKLSYWNSDVISEKRGNEISVKINNAGEYVFTYNQIYDFGCIFSTDLSVTVNETPQVEFLGDTIFYRDMEISVVPVNQATYYWEPTGETTNNIKVPKAGEYKVTITKNNCSGSKNINITKKDINFFIPNAFTPNNDGINDTWEIIGIEEYPDTRIRVFDRQGNTICDYKGTEPAWDGTYNESQINSGTYWYVIDLPNGETKKGTITIKRGYNLSE